MKSNSENLDIELLGHYLAANIDSFSNLQRCEKFSDGQSNPTYLLTTASGQYVLRRQPFGELLKSAHAVDREYRVMMALAKTDIPVATALHLCTDTDLIGSQFYVMSYEPGRVFWDPLLPEQSSVERGLIYDEMNRILAALHDIDINSIGLGDFGRPGNYYERQVSRWTKQYKASETERIDAMEILTEWLPANLPHDDGKVSLIHGDYRIDNMIFNSNSTNVRALLDWELSTLGHPYADLAYQCMQLRLDHNSVIPGLGDTNRSSLGIPSEQEYIERYCERRSLAEIPNWNYYLAFSFFRLAAILQGVLRRALDGNASNQKAQMYGALTPILANMALDVINH